MQVRGVVLQRGGEQCGQVQGFIFWSQACLVAGLPVLLYQLACLPL
jgi:hypothetical protein